MTDQHEPRRFIEPGPWAAHARVVTDHGKPAAGLTRNADRDDASGSGTGPAYGELQNALTNSWQVTTR